MNIKLLAALIKNNNNKIKNLCINCSNYKNNIQSYPEDEIYNVYVPIGKCRLFEKQNLVTGETQYENAMFCRIDEKKCGRKGRYYQSNNNQIKTT